MENDLIRRSEATALCHAREDCLAMTDRMCGYVDAAHDIDRGLQKLPAVDAVEVPKGEKFAFGMVAAERERQKGLWGYQSGRHPFEWMSILGEEFGELCQAVNETFFRNPKHPERGGVDTIICEAVQVAAVAVQIIVAFQDGQRRGDGDGA